MEISLGREKSAGPLVLVPAQLMGAVNHWLLILLVTIITLSWNEFRFLFCLVELVPTVMIDDLDKSCAKAEPNFDK
jgi:hypothetical protein